MMYNWEAGPIQESRGLTTESAFEDRDTDRVQSASMDSFPASDPPSWGSLRAGPPRTGREPSR